MKKLCLALGISCTLLLAGCGSPSDSIKEATGLSQEQAKTALETLKSIGVTEFDDVSVLNKDKGMYYIEDDKYGRVFFLLKDGKIASIENKMGVVIYNAEGKIANLEEVNLTDEQIAEFQIIAQEAIKKQLKSPSTAQFNDIKVQRNKTGVIVTGSVDAQNSFGAMLRNAFMVTINYDTKSVVTANIF